MDVLIGAGLLLAPFIFLWLSPIWVCSARTEESEEVRLQKMVSIFLVWFLFNFLYLMSQLMAPVWYEPAPVVPGLIALQVHLPCFILFSTPFILDMVNQLRSKE